MYQTAYNTTDRPLVTNDFGGQVDGFSYGTVDTTSDFVKQAIVESRLILMNAGDLTAPSSSDEARAAADTTKQFKARHDRLKALTSDELRTLASENDLLGAADEDVTTEDLSDLHKSELIARLVPVVGDSLPAPEKLSSKSSTTKE